MYGFDDMMRWLCGLIGELHIKKWDEDKFIVFNGASGQSHFLNDIAIEVLNLLQQNSLTTCELISQVAQLYDDLPSDSDLQVYIETIISDLDNIGLIKPDVS